MGDFSDALKQGISKYIARFGQTFSKSVETVEVAVTKYIYVLTIGGGSNICD